MKILILTLLSIFSFANAQVRPNNPVKIACWDVKSASGSKPLMLIDALDRTGHIRKIVFNDLGEDYSYLPRTRTEVWGPTKITNERSPYKGANDYSVIPQLLRLVMTPELNYEGLKNANVDGRGRGHAAVLDIDRNLHQKWSGGNFYIRLRCRLAQ